MSLFQNSVITKYVNLQNKETILNKWSIYKTHFLNPVIQENIRNSKEEQYQGEFLIDLFVYVLGYTKNPTPNFNLTTEIKNEKDSKKADGGIIVNDKVIGVIELKGTNTTDLQKIEVQAFGYKNNQKDCIYVITSNFEKLRFYIDNAIEHEEFNLFTLSLKEFEILYLCLAYENISQGIPKKLKDESLSHEDLITKQLYKDYSLFKRELFQNLTQLNPQFEALELFKKSQKLLDRFLFLFFAEDRQLLPPNSVRLILNQWTQLKELDEYKPLYERFKKYFGYLNTGFKGKQHDIFAYNGGLFKPDEILDNILIDDEILYKNILKLSDYDFSSEVDVNILGHIFENSLNELDEIKAQLDGGEIDKSTSKRKKDGVFYTPKYITKYIVENTVGKLCTEKKSELQIIEEEYFTDKKRQIQTKKNLLDKLTRYRDWLLKITIVDPACGSGAFLNEALNFLIIEHKYIDELETKLLGGGIVFPNIENSILENNLFGVDINEESVEIAKLSLWLRTAQPNRKLNDLNNNIKCGNSLIDDPEVAGDKAFCWEKEFPKVFANGGFDVVIGNPPYVRNEFLKNEDKQYYEKKYHVFTGKSDIYVYFFELAYCILRKDGFFGVISSSKYTKTKYGKILIDFLQKETKIDSFIDFQDLDVFSGIVAYPSIIFFRKIKNINLDHVSKLIIVSNENINEFSDSINSIEMNQLSLFDRLGSWTSGGINNNTSLLFERIEKENLILEKIIERPQVGIKTGSNACFVFNKNEIPTTLENSKFLQDYLVGREVKRYQPINPINKIIFPYFYKNNTNLELIQNIEEFRNEFIFFKDRQDVLSKRAIIDKGILNFTKKWYEYQQIKLNFPYKSKFIVYPDISSTVNFTFAENMLYDMTCFGLPSSSNSLLGILNSKLIKTYLDSKCVKARGGYLRLKSQYILNIPIPQNYENVILNALVDKMIEQNKMAYNIAFDFENILSAKSETKLTGYAFKNWYNFSNSDILLELKKHKITSNIAEESDWLKFFNIQKQNYQKIKSNIEQTDKEIDQMVYALYGLTEEEIGIVEKSFI